MKRILAAAGVLAISGCDQVVTLKTPDGKESCFSVMENNGQQPYSPVLVNGCTGQTWLLVRANTNNGGFTYQWYALHRYDYENPSLSRN